VNASITIAPILRAAWPDHTAKNAARALGVSVRTVHGWLAERCCPSVSALLAMSDRNDNLRAELIRRLQGNQDDGMAQGVLPLAGGGLAAPRHPPCGTRHGLASEG
jgi:hypothetical protein